MAAVLLFVISIFLVIAFRAAWETICCYYLTPWRIRRFMAKQGVYGPDPRPLVGNQPDVAALDSKATSTDMVSVDHDIVGRLLPHYVLWSKQYGERFIFWYGSEPRMCLTEMKMIKELLSSKYSRAFGKSWLQQQNTKHLIGRGLLMANGKDWFHQRHIVAPAFMGDKLKGKVRYMVECTKKAMLDLYSSVESGNSEVEMGEYMRQLTGDIIARTEFDSSYVKGKRIFHLLTSLQELTAQSTRHLSLPGSRLFPSKFRRETMELKMELERLLMEIIQIRKDCVEVGNRTSYGDDLLGMLLAESKKKREGFSVSLQLLMDECKTFFFAGHETTSLFLTWTVMLLATNPEWQDRVRAEVLNVCGEEAPSTDHLSKLPLLNMVLNESLRLYPPALVLARMVFEDIKLEDLHIPKGLSIWIPVLAIHHSLELWGKDVNEFKPERFAGKPLSQLRYFMPFAAGPRNCIGQSFALMEGKIIMAMLLTHFSFTISENYRHSPTAC